MKETEIREQVLALCEVLDNKKALDILAVNVADKTIIADWFIIASGRSTTQVKALCDELEEKAAERGLIARRKEGYQEGRWIVVDFGTILVHLFHPEEREYYNLERLWVDDPQHCINYSREHAESALRERHNKCSRSYGSIYVYTVFYEFDYRRV